MQAKNAIILLSGGMDSLVCTAIAKDFGYNLNALHINYKQRTEAKELQSFHQICDFYSIHSRLVVDISYLANIGASSLTDVNIEVSEPDLETNEIPTSYVPFRNANILAIATSWAEVIKAESIIIGAVEEDSSGYPDTRVSFFNAFEKVISEGTKNEFKMSIETPIIQLRKSEIVKKGIELNAPFQLSWSCYKNNDIACGNCDSCALRLRGFLQANASDPILYSMNND